MRRVAIAIVAGMAVTVVPGFLPIMSSHTLTAALLGQGVWAVFLGATYTVGTVLALDLFPVAVGLPASSRPRRTPFPPS